MSHEEQRFVDEVRRSLDARSAQLPPAVAMQLREAREHALAAGERGTPRFWWPAAPIVAVLALAVGLVWLGRPLPSPTITIAQVPLDNGSDLELLLSQDGPEFYRDLEFYYWLAQEQGNAG